MNEKMLRFALFILFSGVFFADAWNPYSEQSRVIMDGIRSHKLNKTVPYCYHFTWMGRKFNKWTFKNIRNKTCNQYFKDKKTLCINPMVATDNGGKPDLEYILDNHAAEATCRLTEEHVCVKYTVYYNGIISYESRYCSIVNVEEEGRMQNGCIQEKRGSELIEVCACRSQPGRDGICNSSPPKFGVEYLIIGVAFNILLRLL